MFYRKGELPLRLDWQRPDFKQFTDGDIENYRQWLTESRLKKDEEILAACPVTAYLDGFEPRSSWGGWLVNQGFADWRRFCIDRNYAEMPHDKITVCPDFTKTSDYIGLGADFRKSAKKGTLAFSFDGDGRGRDAVRRAFVCDFAVSSANADGVASFSVSDTEKTGAYLALGCGVKGVNYEDAAINALADRFSDAKRIFDGVSIVFSEFSMAHYASLATDKQEIPMGRMMQIYSRLTDMGYQVDFVCAHDLMKENCRTRVAIVPATDGFSWYELCELDKFGKEKGTTLACTAAGQYEKWGFGKPYKDFYLYYKEAILEHELEEAKVKPKIHADRHGIILCGVEGAGHKIICARNTFFESASLCITVKSDAEIRRVWAYNNEARTELPFKFANGTVKFSLPDLMPDDAVLLMLEEDV